MRISGFGLHLTDRCNARCLHCAYHCAPGVNGIISFEQARSYLQEMADQPLELVSISGGEPCLYFGLVIQVVREARRLGVPGIWVFTNGYWATSQTTATSRLARLKEAGMTRLCLSADAFHQPFVPPVYVSHAIVAARQLGLEIVLDVRFLGPPEENNPANRVTREILRQLGDLTGVEIWRGQPWYVGRAADLIAAQAGIRAGIPSGPCPGLWSAGTLENPGGVDVDSHGEVTLCPGLSIGTTKERSLSRILAEYEPQQHPIIRELVASGPAGLAQMAQWQGYMPRSGYVDECHLCYDVRQFLRPWYPKELAPEICYQEADRAFC